MTRVVGREVGFEISRMEETKAYVLMMLWTLDDGVANWMNLDRKQNTRGGEVVVAKIGRDNSFTRRRDDRN